MSKRFFLTIVVAALFLVLFGALAGSGILASGEKPVPEAAGSSTENVEDGAVQRDEPSTLGMPVPGFEGVPEMIDGDQDAPGVVSSGMPVPGFEDVPEMIVVKE